MRCSASTASALLYLTAFIAGASIAASTSLSAAAAATMGLGGGQVNSPGVCLGAPRCVWGRATYVGTKAIQVELAFLLILIVFVSRNFLERMCALVIH